jgi:acyl carrier protein
MTLRQAHLGANKVTFLSEADVAKRVIALCQAIDETNKASIAIDASLTHTLGFDSLKLLQFFAGMEQLYPGIALEDWFIEHSADGRDTLGNAVSYLSRFLKPGR